MFWNMTPKRYKVLWCVCGCVCVCVCVWLLITFTYYAYLPKGLLVRLFKLLTKQTLLKYQFNEIALKSTHFRNVCFQDFCQYRWMDQLILYLKFCGRQVFNLPEIDL